MAKDNHCIIFKDGEFFLRVDEYFISLENAKIATINRSDDLNSPPSLCEVEINIQGYNGVYTRDYELESKYSKFLNKLELIENNDRLTQIVNAVIMGVDIDKVIVKLAKDIKKNDKQ